MQGRGLLRPSPRTRAAPHQSTHAKKKITWEGDINIQRSHRRTSIATTRPNWPSGLIRWKLFITFNWNIKISHLCTDLPPFIWNWVLKEWFNNNKNVESVTISALGGCNCVLMKCTCVLVSLFPCIILYLFTCVLGCFINCVLVYSCFLWTPVLVYLCSSYLQTCALWNVTCVFMYLWTFVLLYFCLCKLLYFYTFVLV